MGCREAEIDLPEKISKKPPYRRLFIFIARLLVIFFTPESWFLVTKRMQAE
jgi:hypothetical protein